MPARAEAFQKKIETFNKNTYFSLVYLVCILISKLFEKKNVIIFKALFFLYSSNALKMTAQRELKTIEDNADGVT